MKYQAIFIAISLLGTVGCKTTAPTMHVNGPANEITLHSALDRTSTLADLKKNTAVSNSVQVLEDKHKGNPTDTSVMYDLTNIYLSMGKSPEARSMCRKALSLDLRNLKGKKMLGKIEFAAGNVEKAEIIFNTLGGAESKDSEILNLLGLIALQKQDPNLAFNLFGRSVRTDSENISARMNLATMYIKYGHYQSAAANLERVLKIVPTHGDALLHLGIVKSQRQDYPAAIKLYQSVLALEPDNGAAQFNLAIAQRQSKNLKEALATVKKFRNQRDLTTERILVAEELQDGIENDIEKEKQQAIAMASKAGEIKTLSAKNSINSDQE